MLAMTEKNTVILGWFPIKKTWYRANRRQEGILGNGHDLNA
jgi:hypothetical protein